MEPITLIVTAITLGAAAALKPITEQAIKDAYAGVKQIIIDRYQKVQTGITLLEGNPGEETFQETTKTLLKDTDAGKDEELLRQAKALTQLVEERAPDTIAEVHIKLADVKAAANFKIENVTASGDQAHVDLDVQKVESGGDFIIDGIKAGGKNRPDPKA